MDSKNPMTYFISYWSYCFCSDYENRKCELCLIVDDFNNFAEMLHENVFNKYFFN